MSKSIYFFGVNIFGQLISLLNRSEVNKAVRSNSSDKHCKGFTTWNHLVTMLFCTLGHCYSLREVVAGCLGLKGKTEHVGLLKLPRRSTLSDANRKRTPKVFEDIYHSLLSSYRSVISDSRFIKKYGRDVFIVDSTTITLFRAILKSVGRKPKSGKEKGGIKVHTLLKGDEGVPQLVWYSKASASDILFLKKIKLQKDAFYVFDKGYVDHEFYEKFTKEGVFFVTRLKEGAYYEDLEELDIPDHIDPGVIKDQWINLAIRRNGKIIRYTRVRRIVYWDDINKRPFEFITNLADIDAGYIAALYKSRWEIETLFKQLKQNFPLKYFLGDNENAIIIQIWCSLIANLLLTVIKRRVKRNWAFSNIMSFVRLHLFNYLHLINFLNDPDKDWEKEEKAYLPLFPT